MAGHKGNWCVPCSCVLNTHGCPQVFYTAPVIHPVRVHKFPWQTSQCSMGSILCRMCDVKKSVACIGGSSTYA
jgi:hypothetical protein